MVFIRFAFILLAALSIIYVCVWMFMCARQRDLLERKWSADGGDTGSSAGRRFVRDRMAVYRHRLRRWLVLCVYVVPVSVMALVIYVTNSD